MNRKFCSKCLTMHDGQCSPRALAAVGGTGKKAKKSTSPSNRDLSTDGEASSVAGPQAKASLVGTESETPADHDVVLVSVPPIITKEELVDALTVSLPKVEADKFRALAAKMEANAKANRERVAAFKAGLTVSQYRERMKG